MKRDDDPSINERREGYGEETHVIVNYAVRNDEDVVRVKSM